MGDLHQRFAENVRRLARERGITLSHVPDFAGIAPRHFWAVLSGSRSPTLQWMRRLADALEVDVVDLIRYDARCRL